MGKVDTIVIYWVGLQVNWCIGRFREFGCDKTKDLKEGKGYKSGGSPPSSSLETIAHLGLVGHSASLESESLVDFQLISPTVFRSSPSKLSQYGIRKHSANGGIKKAQYSFTTCSFIPYSARPFVFAFAFDSETTVAAYLPTNKLSTLSLDQKSIRISPFCSSTPSVPSTSGQKQFERSKFAPPSPIDPKI